MHESISQIWRAVGHSGDVLPTWLLTMSLWTGALFIVAFMADRALRKQVAPRWRMALYVVVFVRLGLPMDWQSPVSIVPSASESSLAVGEGGSDLMAPTLPAPLTQPGSAEAPDAAERPATSSLSVTWGHGFMAFYLLGVLGLLGSFARARRILRKEIRTAHAAGQRLATLPAAGGAEVLEHETLGPLAFGVAKPVILLPRALIETLDDEELACVVAHEKAHLDRRDPALASALALVVAFAWPLLPVWLTAARIRELVEHAADERAIEPAGHVVYGRTLIKLAGRPVPRPALATGLHLGSFARIRGRIAALGRRRHLPAAAQVGVVTAIAGLVLACAGMGEGEGDSDLDRRCEDIELEATHAHDQAEKEASPELRRAAAKAYDAYAEECSGQADYADMLYFRAELTWAIASETHAGGDESGARSAFAKAHTQFIEALDVGPGKFTKDAAYAQMLAKQNEWSDDPSLDHVDARSGFEPSAYSARELELLESYDTYERHISDPSDEGLQKVLLERARLAMANNRFDEAEPPIRRLLDGSEGTRRHVAAANMLTDLLTVEWTKEGQAADARRRATLRLSAWLQEVRKRPLYEHEDAGKLREAVPRLEAGLMWKQGMLEREAGDDVACARTFAAIATAWPEHDRLDGVLLNRATCEAGAGSLQAAKDIVRTMQRTMPASELLDEARAVVTKNREME